MDTREFSSGFHLPGCRFCEMCITGEEITRSNDHAFIVPDARPLTPGHCLVITKRHFRDFFECTPVERDAVFALLLEARNSLLETYPEISGFNAGLNVGRSAGQSILHAHIHLIPRRPGDLPMSKGGVRGLFYSKSL